MVAPNKGEHFLQRRQQRIDRRRSEILTAAARVIAEKGYANTGTKEIAEAAGVAEGTLYNYFDSKRDILLAIAEETEVPLESVVMGAERIVDRAALVAMAERTLEISEEQRAFMRVMLNEVWADEHLFQEFIGARLKRIHIRLTAFVAERVKDDAFRRVDPAVTAQMVMGLFGSMIVPMMAGWSGPRTAEQRHTLAEAIVGLLLDGVAHRV